MAEQARLKTQSDYGVSLTGVAGPDSLRGIQPAQFLLDWHMRKDRVIKANIAGRVEQMYVTSRLPCL